VILFERVNKNSTALNPKKVEIIDYKNLIYEPISIKENPVLVPFFKNLHTFRLKIMIATKN
jgi:hypothetical protein